MRDMAVVACCLVFLTNKVFNQYIEWGGDNEKDLYTCPYQLALAQKDLRRLEKKIDDLDSKIIHNVFS
jgi:hypothetical protein